jgi:hypothetical protein
VTSLPVPVRRVVIPYAIAIVVGDYVTGVGSSERMPRDRETDPIRMYARTPVQQPFRITGR